LYPVAQLVARVLPAGSLQLAIDHRREADGSATVFRTRQYCSQPDRSRPGRVQSIALVGPLSRLRWAQLVKGTKQVVLANESEVGIEVNWRYETPRCIPRFINARDAPVFSAAGRVAVSAVRHDKLRQGDSSRRKWQEPMRIYGCMALVIGSPKGQAAREC
jgi:hypothetical protein